MAKISVDQALIKAKSHAKKGKIEEAKKLYQAVLEAFPKNKRALQGLAALNKPKQPATTQGPPQDAINQLIQLYNQGQLVVVVEQAQALTEQYPEAFIIWNILGAANKGLGRVQSASEAFKKVTELNPTYADGFSNLGVTLKDQGKLDEAIASCEKALSLKPDYAEAYYNMGNALQDQRKLDEAIASYNKALSLKPDYAEAYYNMGNAFQDQRKLDEAIASYNKALSLKPDYAEAYYNLGNALQDQRKLDEAIASYNKALSLKPDNADAYNNMGNALKDQVKLNEAIASYNKALSLKPDYAEAYNNMGYALQDQGKLEEAIASYNKALSLKPDYAEAFSNLFLCLDSTINENPRLNTDLAVAFNEFTSSNVKQKLQKKNISRSQKIRLGFVSGDLNDHPVGYFIENLFKYIDKDTFEIFIYYNSSKNSNQTYKLRQFTKNWKVIRGVPDDKAATVIHKDDIDVLVDLSGHTALNRLPVFSFRPCAVQASWLGYFGSTWLNEMDFIIGDRFVTPANRHNLFSEKVALLNSYLCFAPPDFDIPILETPALKNKYITFGCFNNSAKINNQVILTWSELLREVENSIFFFKGRTYKNEAKNRIIKEFEKNNINPSRLVFEGNSSRVELLESYNKVDVALDPFPYPGGTTTCEALWMGVPTVTQKGNSFISSVGETIAINSGHPELCTANLQDYVALAIKLASDFDLLNKRKIQRREKVMETPLFDGQLFAKDFERLIFGMLEEMR